MDVIIILIKLIMHKKLNLYNNILKVKVSLNFI